MISSFLEIHRFNLAVHGAIPALVAGLRGRAGDRRSQDSSGNRAQKQHRDVESLG